jgi:serine phosphatase RsbU (regulator of sigma subunit)
VSRVFWISVFGVLLVATFLQAFALVRFFERTQPKVLTTPHGLALIPLTFALPDDVKYLRQYRREVTPGLSATPGASELKYVQALLPIYAATLFFWLTGMFFYVFSRVRRLERAFVLLSTFVTAYMLLFVDYFTLGYTGNFFLPYNVIVIAPFLYLYRSVYKLETRGWLHITIIFAGVGLFLFLPIKSTSDEILTVQILGMIFLAVFLYCAYLFVRSERQRQSSQPGENFWAGRILNFSLIFAVALPPAFFFMLYYAPVQVDINYNALFYLPSFFPMIFLTLSLRWGLVNFHAPVSIMAVRTYYFVFFGFLYWFTIGYSLNDYYHATDPRHSGQIWVLGLFLILVDPLRTFLLISLDQYTAARRKILDSFLLQSSQQVANPGRVNTFIEYLASSLGEGLGCYWVKVIFSRDLFHNWDSASDKIIYLPPDDPFWIQARTWVPRKRYPLLTQTFIGPVRDFLQARGAFMILSMDKFKAGIMISERRGQMPFYSEDVRFLRQITREAEILIQNYVYLIENVKLKRRERELAFNARIQKKIIPGFRQFKDFSFWSYSRAYESVTGDYIDLMEISENRYAVLLGDVSGHGISSGYLVAFARAYLRGVLIDQQETISAALGGLNAYLAENYRGNEFITLFVLQLDFTPDEIRLSYINAGQHPVILDHGNGMVMLEDGQRLLGVAATEYVESTLKLEYQPTRIILYSDGAFDVFNKAGKILGQKKFYDWVGSSLDKTAAEQLAFLRQRIESYTGSGIESDDLALIILQLGSDT